MNPFNSFETRSHPRVSHAFRGLLLAALFFHVSSSPAFGTLDLNNNRVSDIWELLNPDFEVGASDSDGDGYSDLEEIAAGTNPGDPESFLSAAIDTRNSAVRLKWSGVAGKKYVVQNFDVESERWTDFVVLDPKRVNSAMQTTLPSGEVARIYRLLACDCDQDEDGLTAWEEFQMGWSDDDGWSSGQVERLDYAAALRALESPGGMKLANGDYLPSRKPTREEAARFLMQASFGPTEESIDEVCSIGIAAWIDRQRSLSPATMSNEMFRNGLPYVSNMPLNGWWRMANTAPDQLRQRLAYALSQIFVVGVGTVEVIGSDPFNQSKYYDIFVENAFENYRTTLEKVTYSPAMGVFLSHLKNRKSDLSINRFPDENFAREIMQLFTIGLWELNPDGSRKVENGKFIPTYDNKIITEMAKVFTGMSFSRVGNNGRDATSFYDIGYTHDHRFPMKVWDEEHEVGKKSIVGGVVLSDIENGGVQLTGEEEVQAALDALVGHPNIAPFVGRLLIQRFTGSNPSPQYVSRVASVWGDSGAPDRGNLSKVIEAILLDPEARTPGLSLGAGKVREPIIRTVHFYRALNILPESGRYNISANQLQESLGQFPTLSPSVFNFYSPDFSPQGVLADSDLVSPELEIATSSQLINSDNLLHIVGISQFMFMTPTYERELALAGDVDVLLEHLNTLLVGGRLSEASLEIIRNVVSLQSSDLRKVQTAVQLIASSPEFVTLD